MLLISFREANSVRTAVNRIPSLLPRRNSIFNFTLSNWRGENLNSLLTFGMQIRARSDILCKCVSVRVCWVRVSVSDCERLWRHQLLIHHLI